MKNRPQKPTEQRPPQPPIRIGRVVFRDGALDLDPEFADDIRRRVAERDESLSRSLGCLMSLEDLDDAATRCAKYLEQAMQKGDHDAIERFASLLFAIDITAKAHGDELAQVWPPPRSRAEALARAPVGDNGLIGPAASVAADTRQSEVDDGGEFSLSPPTEEDVQAAAARAQAEREAEEAAAAELAAERAALVAGGPDGAR